VQAKYVWSNTCNKTIETKEIGSAQQNNNFLHTNDPRLECNYDNDKLLFKCPRSVLECMTCQKKPKIVLPW